MASLTGTKIKNTYDGLLKTNDNEPLDAALITITDGLGNGSALSLSSVAAQISGDLDVTGNFDVNGSVINFSNTNGKLVTNLSGATENVISSYVSSTDSDYEKIRISSEQFIVNTGSGTTSTQRLVIAETGLATFANNVVVDGTLSVGSFGVFDASVTADSVISTEGVYQAGSGAETGLMFPALDEISLKIDNTERLGLDSTGATITGTLGVSGEASVGSLSSGDITLSGAVRNSANPLNTYFNFPTSTSFNLLTNGSTKISAISNGVGLYGVITLGGTVVISGDTWTDGKIMHKDDLDTYIDFPSNDNISLVTGGAQRLLVNNAGAMITGGLGVSGDYGSTNGRISLTNGDIEVGGGISIANSLSLASFSPNANLLVIGDTGAGANQGMTIVSPTGSTGNIYFADGTTGDAQYRGTVTYNHSTDTLYLAAAAANKVAIDTNGASVTGTLAVSGNAAFDTNTLFVDAASNVVTIGSTTNYGNKLTIYDDLSAGATPFAIRHTNGDDLFSVYLNQTTGETRLEAAFDGSTDHFTFYTSGSEKMRIDSSGNVGIGVSPSAWGSGFTGLDLGGSTAANIGGISRTRLAANLYYDGSDFRLKQSYGGAYYFQDAASNIHTWGTAATGAGGAVATLTERMRIDSSGNVGIGGTAANGYRLEILGSSEAANTLGMTYVGVGAAAIKVNSSGALEFGVDGADGSTERMRIDSSGNVGIGVSPSGAKLDVAGGNIRITNSTTPRISFKNTSALDFSIYSADDSKLIIGQTGIADYVIINSSGNVGIGESGPTQKLTIGGSGGTLANTAAITLEDDVSGGSRNWSIANGASGAGALQIGALTFSSSNAYGGNPLASGTERMRITSAGYLKASNTGVYNNTAGVYHEIRSSAASNTVAEVTHIGTDPYGVYMWFTEASPNNTSNYFLACVDSTTERLIIHSNGNVVNSNNSYGAISDAKLKENVTDASPKLEDLMQVKVRNFNYIGDDKKQLGVVAQELEEVFPSMIDESPDTEEREVEVRDEEGNIVYKTEQVLVSEALLDEEGNVIEEAVYETIATDEPEMTKEKFDLGTVTKSVKYSVFVPMLIKAIQELNAKVESLESQLNAQ